MRTIALQSYEINSYLCPRKQKIAQLMKHAYVFPGQGAQAVGMGKDLYDNVPEAKALFEQAASTAASAPEMTSCPGQL